MEKRIEKIRRVREPSQVKDLLLDNCISTSIVGLTDEFCNLETLSMCSCGLTNLKSFPNLPKLKKLDLTDNKISGGLNHLLGSQKLKALFLIENKIDNLEVLEPLKNFENLTFLYLGDCGVTKTENYREKIFALLPNLKYLDGFDKNDQEADDSETEEGEKFNNEDEDEDEEGAGEDSDDEESSEVGLDYLENTIDEESEGADYSPEEKESDDDVIEVDESESESDDEEDEQPPKDKKRKLDDES